MFTVILCDDHIINDCYHKYHIYLKPFFDEAQFAFCAWNAKAESLDEALPGLRALIRHKKEWRAVIVNDSSTWGFDEGNKRNPFDFVGAGKKNYRFADFEQIRAFRTAEKETTGRAMTNPLTRLAIWLCGAPINAAPTVCYADERETIEAAETADAYFQALDRLGLKAADAEMDWSREYQFRQLCENFELQGELFNPPQSVIALAERAKNVESELAAAAWTSHTEFDYSRFYIDNLYPEKLRYILFDVSYIKGRRNENRYFSFLTSLLLLASYDCPNGILRSNRVYRLDMQIDPDCVRELCNRYNSKLWATLGRIDEINSRLTEGEHQPIDPYTAEECFESNVTVPVEAVTQESRGNLKAKYSHIGLAGDCPEDEYTNWNEQFHTINKYFVRFLREPRRAVKSAVKEDFRALNHIDDERALRLNEYQKEDVRYVLDEEEHCMVSTATAQLFNTAQYSRKMREADREIRQGIAQRMTKKKTIVIGLLAALAYFLGFLPLLFGNMNTAKSFWFSLAVTGIVLALFLGVGLIELFVLRHQQIKRFRRFNEVMSGILKEIENGVNAFSAYLSHACNVMREFSVLRYSESSFRKKRHILLNHKRIIGEKIQEVNEFFSTYIDPEDIRCMADAEPYDFDFTVMRDYEYALPYAQASRPIDYLQAGNQILIPVEYVESVSLTREELYD